MSKRATIVIMLLFTVSMTGFLLTQVFWIRNALGAMDETFRHVNHNALQGVAYQIGRITYGDPPFGIESDIDTDRQVIPDSMFSPCGLGGLMRVAFSHYKVGVDYEYGILDHLTGRLHYSSAPVEMGNRIVQSPYRQNLRTALGADRFSLVVWFRDDRMQSLKSINSWLLLVSVLLFLGIVAGYVLTISRLLTQKRLAMMQKDFINNTTHEFKTPLASISVAAEMIMAHRGRMPGSQIERYASIIYDENKRLQRHVDKVLQLSLLEEESYRFNRQMVPVQPLLERAVDTARMILRDKGGDIRLDGRFDGELFIDKQHILNVFNNLIENGIKYSHDEPQILVTVFPEEDGLYIKFTDKGIGIPVGEVERIFERMYRIPYGDLYHTSGTGIGLYYVRKVVEAHQGTILVNSVLGEGSCFELYLPWPPL
jgi:two-component system, OmpR family, phosphate regulon sensor histidine kinase PhoR